MKEDKQRTISHICKSKKCPEYIEWNFGFGICMSCKLLGQSEDITEFPNKCNFIEDIKKEITNE